MSDQPALITSARLQADVSGFVVPRLAMSSIGLRLELADGAQRTGRSLRLLLAQVAFSF